MKKKIKVYTSPTAEIISLGEDVILTSREWDTEEMPLTQPEVAPASFVW